MPSEGGTIPAAGGAADPAAGGRPVRRAAIALGANLGDRKATLDAARQAIEALPGFEAIACSEWIETEPVGGPEDQPLYLNGVLLGETIHPPRVLLRALKRLEGEHGRDRSSEVPNGPRTLDLDLLFVGDLRLSEGDLELPHPRMGEREFVLGPLVQISPDELLPGGRTAREALERLRNRSKLVRFEDPADAEAWCSREREAGRTIGFVPTMGALHEGHLALVRAAAAENDSVCVSIFVNPLQFGEDADFKKYPRNFGGDCDLLEAAGCGMAFTGTLANFFPGRLDVTGHLPQHLLEDPGPVAEGLEGAFRKGHFAGVATIVRRLFEVTSPDRAYFGAKDFQQTLVVRDLAERMERGPKVVVLPTVRESSGLAMSSRNARLSDEERKLAVTLSESLFAMRDLWRRGGERDAGKLARALRSRLDVRGIEVEYATVRDPDAWSAEEPKGAMDRAVALVAARIGSVRLIDNIELSPVAIPSPSVP